MQHDGGVGIGWKEKKFTINEFLKHESSKLTAFHSEQLFRKVFLLSPQLVNIKQV